MISHAHYGAVGTFGISAALVCIAFLYFLRWLGVRRHDHSNVKAWRAGSFVLGLACIWIATASPLAALDHEMLTAHMVQHLLLMTLAPPLILLGLPAKLFADPSSALSISVGGPLQSTPAQQPGSVLTHPVFCWVLAAGALLVWHFPAVFMLGLQSQTWHAVEQISFLAAGLLFWWPVSRPSAGTSKWPESAMLLYLFLATLPCDILSGFLVFCDRVAYPAYFSSPHPFGLSALEDQQCAGALMWTCVTVVFLIAAAVFTLRLLSPRQAEFRTASQSDAPRLTVRHSDSHRMETV
jgi:putative membrane protein